MVNSKFTLRKLLLLDGEVYFYSLIFLLIFEFLLPPAKPITFDIVGISEDGIIEAIEYKNNRFALGVQWHPESIYEDSCEAKRIFDEFIKMSNSMI